MSSLKSYSLNLPEEQYHRLPAWSYSIISRYAKEGFPALAHLLEPITPTASMEFGSFFDAIVTRGAKGLNEYCLIENMPTPKEKEVLDMLANGTTIAKTLMDVSDTVWEQVFEATGYYGKTRKFETKVQQCMQYSAYFEAAMQGKKMMSAQDWEDARTMYKAMKANSYINELFYGKDDNVEHLFQMQFQVDYELPSGQVTRVKIMPDLLNVSHNTKTIRPVDLKTSAVPAYQFSENFLKFRYDLQAHTYSDVLKKVISQDEQLRDYTILPYLFVDISREDKIPVVYEYDQTDFTQINGLCFTSKGHEYQYKHWTHLLDEIISYRTMQAIVPAYIKLDEPNNLLTIIANNDNK